MDEPHMSHTCLSPGSTALPLQMSWKKRFCFFILMSFPFTLRSIDCVPVSFLSFFLFFYFWFFRDRVSLYSPGCSGTHFVDQAGLELRNLPASASQVLGLKACATTPGFFFFFFFFLVFQDRVSLCSPGCPGTHFVDQAGLKLRNPPVSTS